MSQTTYSREFAKVQFRTEVSSSDCYVKNFEDLFSINRERVNGDFTGEKSHNMKTK